MYSWPSESGWIPNALWQYVVVEIALLTKGGGSPWEERYACSPSRTPRVTATGRTRNPTDMRDRTVIVRNRGITLECERERGQKVAEKDQLEK